MNHPLQFQLTGGFCGADMLAFLFLIFIYHAGSLYGLGAAILSFLWTEWVNDCQVRKKNGTMLLYLAENVILEHNLIRRELKQVRKPI